MTRSEALKFISENPLAFVATVEGDCPRVRGFMTVRADEKGLLFNTGKSKDVFRQLGRNPKVELCFFSPKTNEQLRVSGTVEFTEDKAVKDAVLEKFKFLKPVVEKQGYGVMAPFFVRKARACHWSFDKNMQPKEWFDL